jgi:hypothetical protein
MGKSRNCDKELSTLDKLKQENKLLKRQLSSLQKQLDRIDYNRYQNIVDAVNKIDKENRDLEKRKELEKLKKKWLCRKCGKGHLLLNLFEHPVKGTLYYRKCSLEECDNKTKFQQYKENTEGLEKKDL